MSDWLPLDQTELWASVPEADSPPPLPPAHVNDKVAWLIASVPLIGLFIERIVTQTSGPPPVNGVILCYFLAYSILILSDVKQIAKSGRNPEKVNLGGWFWLVPVYLFKRAKTLGQPLNYFWAWVVTFCIAVFIASPLLSSSTDSQSPSTTRSPSHITDVTPNFKTSKSNLTGDMQGFSRILIQSENKGTIIINKVIINDGNCPYSNEEAGNSLKFGEEISVLVMLCDVIEVKIETDQGTSVYKW